MQDYLEHSSRMGTYIINANGAKAVVNILGNKTKAVINIAEGGSEYTLTITKEDLSDVSGRADSRKYNLKPQCETYSFELYGYESPLCQGHKDFSISVGIDQRNGVPTQGRIMKLRDPGHARNPYSGVIVGHEPDQVLEVFDIKNGGDTELMKELVNLCVSTCAANIERSSNNR